MPRPLALLALLPADGRKLMFPCDMLCFRIKTIKIRICIKSVLIQRPQLLMFLRCIRREMDGEENVITLI